MRRLRYRVLRLIVWCARRHRHHYWSPLAMTLLLCCVVGSVISHIDATLIVGELCIALMDMGLQGYNAHHHLKRAHRPLQRENPTHWFSLRRRHLWRELRFKAPLALALLVVIVIVLLGFR